MSNDWIKFRKKNLNDGRVRIVAAKCNVSTVTVIGGLVTLWSFADDFLSDSGVLEGWSADDFNRHIGIENFVQSLPEDWIDLTGEWIKLPEYQQHNGTTAKTRAVTAKRVKKHRECNKNVTQPPLPDKKRIDKNKIPPVVPLFGECKFLRMDQSGFELARSWYREKGFPDRLLNFAVDELDRWLGSDSNEARKARDRTTSHHQRLYAPWVVENAQKLMNACGGRNGAPERSGRLPDFKPPPDPEGEPTVDAETAAKLQKLTRTAAEALGA